MQDALGNDHLINESIALAEAWEITKVSNRRLDPDHPQEIVNELKAIKDNLKRLDRIAERAYNSAWPPVFETAATEEEMVKN